MRSRWYVWPLTLGWAVFGVGGLIRCVYKGWWAAAVMTSLWLVALAVVAGPSHVAWKQRRHQQRAHRL